MEKTIWQRQYELVRTYLVEHYPDAEWVSMSRSGYNMIDARIEGPGQHDWIKFFVGGSRISYVDVHEGRKHCTESCLHQGQSRWPSPA